MWERQPAEHKFYPGQENFSLPLGSVDPGGHLGPGAGPGLSEFGGLQDQIKQEPGVNGSQGHNHHRIHLQVCQTTVYLIIDNSSIDAGVVTLL